MATNQPTKMTDELIWLRGQESQLAAFIRGNKWTVLQGDPLQELEGFLKAINARIIALLEESKPHQTRTSDSSLYDEVCVNCGASDGRGDDRLNQPCPKG